MTDEPESLPKHGNDPEALVEVGMVFEGTHVVCAVPRATRLCGAWSPVAPPWLMIHARSGGTQPSWLCSPWAQRISGAKFEVRMRGLLAILLFPYLGLEEEVLDRIPSALYTNPQLHRD